MHAPARKHNYMLRMLNFSSDLLLKKHRCNVTRHVTSVALLEISREGLQGCQQRRVKWGTGSANLSAAVHFLVLHAGNYDTIREDWGELASTLLLSRQLERVPCPQRVPGHAIP